MFVCVIYRRRKGKGKVMRQKGKIINWNDDKGFGFIAPINGGKQLFIHINSFKSRNNPSINQIITYDISRNIQGRICAVNALKLGETPSKKIRNRSYHSSIIIVFIFAIFLVLSVLLAKLPIIILVFYFLTSLITFIIYAVDKSAAQNETRRTPESILHLLSLVGGWSGALIAQQKLRHKSKKQPFRTIFWMTVIINFFVFIWLFGNAIFQSVLV